MSVRKGLSTVFSIENDSTPTNKEEEKVFSEINNLKILKFGSTSVASSHALLCSARIIKNAYNQNPYILVVASASGDMTDNLVKIFNFIQGQKPKKAISVYNKMVDVHKNILYELIDDENKANKIWDYEIQPIFKKLKHFIQGVSILGDTSDKSYAYVLSFGESCSNILLNHALLSVGLPSEYINTSEGNIIRTDNNYSLATVNFQGTKIACRKNIAPIIAKKRIPVLTGFIGRDTNEHTTLLGRGGSNYTATIVAYCLQAKSIELWTDTDGILTTDPKIVKNSQTVPILTYQEAVGLAFFGAQVINQMSIITAMKKNIPIYVKNTFNPSATGTKICSTRNMQSSSIASITCMNRVVLISLIGQNMAGRPGFSERLFKATRIANVSSIFITQASSEHTICFAINADDKNGLDKLTEEIKDEFEFEFSCHLMDLDIVENQSIITVVVQDLTLTPGISGQVFKTLGESNINLRAIAQGATDNSISFSVDIEQRNAAIQAIHNSFFEKNKPVNLAVIGVGTVGAKFIDMVHEQNERLEHTHKLKLNICMIANSKSFIINPDGISKNWQKELKINSVDHFFDHKKSNLPKVLASMSLDNPIVVDCTSSDKVVQQYDKFVDVANTNIVTSNRLANILPFDKYKKLHALINNKRKLFLYETTVCIGIPVISTIKRLIDSGDKISYIEGVFSGRLNYLFDKYDGTIAFSQLLRQDQEDGYANADPREYLSGMDTARKLLILAREIGLQFDINNIKIESLLPKELEKITLVKFYNGMEDFDKKIKECFDYAKAQNKVLRYIGSITSDGEISVRLREIHLDSPFAKVKGTDNIVSISSDYHPSPLIIMGSGDSNTATAASVISDVIKISDNISSK